jgi:hypothetical protein
MPLTVISGATLEEKMKVLILSADGFEDSELLVPYTLVRITSLPDSPSKGRQ